LIALKKIGGRTGPYKIGPYTAGKDDDDENLGIFRPCLIFWNQLTCLLVRVREQSRQEDTPLPLIPVYLVVGEFYSIFVETRPWIVNLNLRDGSLESVTGVNLPCARDGGIGFAVSLDTNMRCLSGESKSW
jgi:hypothetical protein